MSILSEDSDTIVVEPSRWEAGAQTWLAAGARTIWWYGWGDNRGPQYASANVTSPGVSMWATQQGKRLEPGGAATYLVEIYNDSAQGGYHNLEGGTFV